MSTLDAPGAANGNSSPAEARSKEAELAAIVASSADAIIGMTLDGTVTSWNAGAEHLLGYSECEMIGKSARCLEPKDVQEQEGQNLARIAAGENIAPCETVRIHKSGRPIELLATLSPVRNESGEIVGASVIEFDISERKRAEAALRESEERFRAAFESSAIGICHIGADGSWLRVNGTLRAITGYSEDELQTTTFKDITHPDDLAGDLALAQRVFEGEIGSYSLEKRYLRKDGSYVWVRKNVSAVRDASGAFLYYNVAVQDISEIKRAEDALRQNEERLRLANEAANIGTFTVELQTGRVQYSPHLAVILGFPGVKETEVELAMQRVHREDVERVRGLYNAAIAGANGGEVKMDFRFVRPGGEVRWMTWLGRVDFRETAAACVPFRIIGACLDITERKQQEEHLNLLMRETAHRSKNLLTVVLAIARRTAAASARDYVRRLEERIAALAESTDLLARSAWRQASLTELIQSQLGHLRDLIGTRIRIEGPPVLVSASSAQSIGMAMHELATNASKYGALSNSAGRVDIRWVIGGKEASEQFMLTWRESGGPPVVAPEREGFGSTVITSLTAEALDGEVELRFDPGGIMWSLSCPASNLAR